MERKPIRLQLSRKAGYDLQALSRNTNGLPAARVARPSKWGNPFVVGRDAPDAQVAVKLYRLQLLLRLSHDPDLLEPLRKKNLACWCALGAPCHADVLLEYANRWTSWEDYRLPVLNREDVLKEIDIWRTAKVLIDSYGEQAALEAGQRADDAKRQGNAAIENVWRRVGESVTALQQTTSAGPVH